MNPVDKFLDAFDRLPKPLDTIAYTVIATALFIVLTELGVM